MKRKSKALKIPRLFKLSPDTDIRLRREAKSTSRTQTAIVEMALMEWFKIKRA